MLSPFMTGLLMPLLSLSPLTAVSGDVDVIGPAEPICAIAGEDVTLPCQLVPPMNAKEMKVTWSTGEASSTVHCYHNGTECGRKQEDKYKGRTEMIRTGIADGTVALKIHSITCSDAGQYMCSFTSDTPRVNSSALYELKVAGRSACDLENELENITREKDYLTEERDTLLKVKDILIKERDNLLRIHYDIIAERDMLQRFIDFLPKDAEWRQARSFADHVTLDPDTAHPQLVLSEDRRSVRRSYQAQDLLNNPQRYDTYSCVLGLERFTSGKHYWEVEVGGVLWYVGVAEESVNRKGAITHSPELGYWAVGVWYGDGYWAFTSPKTPLLFRLLPQTVGVFLDYEAGRVSFYDLEHTSEVFTFPHHPFNQTLRPYFCTWLTNPPLRLRSVIS